MIQELIKKSIFHPRMKNKLKELNKYFYNRKHEQQIRDELVVILNENNDDGYIILSEHPKTREKAVDISIHEKNSVNGLTQIAAIELKFQFPKDLCYPAVQTAIISDMNRNTNHFILILQQRKIVGDISPELVKFKERNGDISVYIKLLEEHEKFPKYHKKDMIIRSVKDKLASEYTFVIYQL